jgi:signal transduction histidine kinase
MSGTEPMAIPQVASPAKAGAAPPVLGADLLPGVVLLDGSGGAPLADRRALALLGDPTPAGLAAWWAAARPLLAERGASLDPAAGASTGELPTPGGGERRLRFSLVCGRVLLLFDKEVEASLEHDLRAASQLRSLAQVTPAVAHDLRAPINAMVLNLEVLKETLAGGPASPPPHAGLPDPRERQLRYVSVLREELTRLHRSLEIYLAHVAPRGDRLEVIDLREPVQDLAAMLRPPAHKQQVQIEVLAPNARVPVLAQRFPLRQALLHLGLAALVEVPAGGKLEIRLERRESPPGRARLRLGAIHPATFAGAAARQAGAGTGEPPRFSGSGTEARLAVAVSILALFGGTARRTEHGHRPLPAADSGAPRAAGGTGEPSGAGAATEINFPLSGSN